MRAGNPFVWSTARTLPLSPMKVRPDDQLPRFTMDQTSGVRSADAFGTGRLAKLRVDLVQLVGAAGPPMRRISDQPQLSRPRHDRANAAFAVLLRPCIVEHREVGIDAADLEELGCGGTADLRTRDCR